MLKGHSDPLNSSFHLSYNMLINSMRIEDTDPEYIIRRSFLQFQTQKHLPDLRARLLELEKQYNSIKVSDEDQIRDLAQWDQ
jgi:ATP-dependent RNA helicase DOB1